MLDYTEEQIMRSWNREKISSPLVTIWCLAYNHEAYIEQALDSFLMQKTDFPFEIVVHDDVSSDRTAEIIKKYTEKFPSIIHPIYETENQYSKQDGSLRRIKYASIKGKYVALCEGDDYWCDETKIQRQAEALEKNPQCSISFCKTQCIEKSGRKRSEVIPSKDIFEEGIVTLQDLVHSEFGCGYWTFHTSGFFYRSELELGYINIMEKEFKVFPYGDMPLQLYCLLNGKGYYIDKIQTCYRKMSGGYSSYMQKHPDAAVQNQRYLIAGLMNFDKLSEGKFHREISVGIRRAEFKIDAMNKKVFKIFYPKYYKIGLYTQLKTFVEIVFPKIYRRLALWKHPL